MGLRIDQALIAAHHLVARGTTAQCFSSSLQFVQGVPHLVTSHRTFRRRQPMQALFALLRTQEDDGGTTSAEGGKFMVVSIENDAAV